MSQKWKYPRDKESSAESFYATQIPIFSIEIKLRETSDLSMRDNDWNTLAL
jgi:hypothetical protein